MHITSARSHLDTAIMLSTHIDDGILCAVVEVNTFLKKYRTRTPVENNGSNILL